ncbi:PASTA domain-containing protein [Bifidobacterium felsineum]|uniref:PASTA domain-containing protein n=1 Tax=Bifidobacterium felsineum TaxID=2045440 RepID=UPI001F0A2D93|nr:PASTA domain-containing protein [Bifidobacterium felsineum]
MVQALVGHPHHCIIHHRTYRIHIHPSKNIPDVTGQTVAEAKTTLNQEGFTQITVTPDTKGGDGKWKVETQTPESDSKQKTSVSVTLNAVRDNSDLPDIAEKGMMLDEVLIQLENEGYSTSDYKIKSDSGKAVLKPSNWIVLSAKDGVIRVHNKVADEEEARKKAEEEKRKAEEEAARKAEEEKKAAEEAARQQAEQQAAAEEAARQAQQQQQQQQQQQAQQSAPQSSTGTVHGGSFCSSQGATGRSSAGTLLTCRVASDGRLRWMK